MRGSQGAIGTPAGACKDKQQKKSFLRCDLGFLFLLLEFYAQTNLQWRCQDRRPSPCLNQCKRCARICHRVQTSLGLKLKGLRIQPKLHLWTPSLIVQMQGCHLVEMLRGIRKRTRDKGHLRALPNHHSHFLHCECTIVPPSPREKRGTTPTSRFPMTCLGLPSTNTVPRTLANDCKDLQFLDQRRFVLEPWQ